MPTTTSKPNNTINRRLTLLNTYRRARRVSSPYRCWQHVMRCCYANLIGQESTLTRRLAFFSAFHTLYMQLPIIEQKAPIIGTSKTDLLRDRCSIEKWISPG